ncbi:ParA family protein [Endothiovibrio diazotrophicus]
MASIATILSPKGGVGKTTIAGNLAALLADLGYSVLMIDGDPQGSLTRFFPLRHQAPTGLAEVFHSGRLTADGLSLTDIDNLALVRNNDPTGDISDFIRSGTGFDKPFRLRFALEQFFADDPDTFDFVVIDTQGASTAIFEACALTADLLVMPVTPDKLSAEVFARTTQQFLDSLKPLRSFGRPIPAVRALLSCTKNTNLAQRYAAYIREHYANDHSVTVLRTEIPFSTTYSQAHTKHVPVHCWERRRSGGTMAPAWQVMHELVWELYPNLRGCYAEGGHERP